MVPVLPTMRSSRSGRIPRGLALTLIVLVTGGLLAGCPASGSDGPTTGGTPVSPSVPVTAAPGTVVPFRTVTPDSAVGKVIGLVAPTVADPFGKAVTDSVIEQVEAVGAELIRCDPGDDPALVLDCARRMATQQVDGWIALQPGDLGEALCDVGPADVPLIAVAAMPVHCQTARVGADDRQAGFLVGSALGKVAADRAACPDGTLVIVTNTAAENTSVARVEGIRAGFATGCPGTVEELVLDAGTQDRAYEVFNTTLATLPVEAPIFVAAVNDGAGLGVVAAVPEERAEQVSVAAIGADQRARCEIVANPIWIGDAAQFPERYGEVAVPALLDALNGKQIPGTMLIETTFVTADSLARMYDDIDDCPAP